MDFDHLPEYSPTEPEALFEAICEAGRMEVADEDERAWNIGDLACLVDTVYGENRIKRFSDEILMPVSTVKQKRSMAAFYEKDTRGLFPNLSRSHYREAMRLGHLGAAILLTMAADNNWTVAQVQREKRTVLGKPFTKEKLLDAVGCIDHVDLNAGRLWIQLDPGLNGYDLLGLVNQPVEVKLYRKAAA